jgi:predicted DsbA family dithiol-disulfide isomerase
MATPITVDIWSDLVCPFCYIGKRHLEAALARFPDKDRVTVRWHAFQLDPNPVRDRSKNIYQRLAEKYGQDVAWARSVTAQTSAMARAAGLQFDYERAVPANTLKAHRLVKLAAEKGLEDRAEERFMSAYFIEGKDLDDPATLAALAAELGLDAAEAKRAIEMDAFNEAVRRDESAAMDMGVRGVPFFLINGEIPLSGAQPVDQFLAALQSAAAV